MPRVRRLTSVRPWTRLIISLSLSLFIYKIKTIIKLTPGHQIKCCIGEKEKSIQELTQYSQLLDLGIAIIDLVVYS
jgi:hypothetical protein